MNINLSTAKRQQTLKGWGTSACWWSQYCVDEKTQDDIINLLYSKEGLGLNIYRYNIGGGFDEENYRVSDPWRRSQSMMLYDRETEDITWDFSRDKTAVSVMKKAVDTKNVDTLILFANSPHYSQTSTGQASGSLLYHTCNIPKSKYRAFADYFLTVTQHFIDEGFNVTHISPINEPQWKWGGSFVWQEGCHYETEEMIEVLHIFAEEIINRKMNVKLCIPETGELLGKTPEYLSAILSDEKIMSVTEIFAYHSYHADNRPEERYEFKKEVVDKHPNLRFDMTEWCELPCKSDTKDFKGALITARIIGQDLTLCGAVSWTSWVAVNGFAFKEDNKDYCDALISSNADFSNWYIAERYYGYAHYSKYIPVGSTVLDIGMRPTKDDNLFNVFAFVTPDNKTVVVIVNEGNEKTLTLSGGFKNMTVITSTQSEKLKKEEKAFPPEVVSKEKSIITLILD